ncbi:MAG: hypothetical protein ACHQ50_02175 [Fimbriimonadales bacterium]
MTRRAQISKHDRLVLRPLAGRVAELASRAIEDEKRNLWYGHNALQPTRPLIFCDPENGWGEILTPDEMQCEGELAREWEWHLRREVFWGERMRDDRVIEPFFNVGYVAETTDWGMHETKRGGESGGSYVWDAPLADFTDMDKLRFPSVNVDGGKTQDLVDLAEATFGDLLSVRVKTSWFWSVGLTYPLVNLRGLEQIMWDMLDCPGDLHRLMAFLRDGTASFLDSLENNGWLSINNDGTYVGSGGFGWTNELPQEDFSGHVRLRDCWGFAESQETVAISPDMFAEFVIPYQLPLMERFGLNCYGCCEPLDKRWHVVKRIPRLRRVSVSAWADLHTMAECLQDNYIFSWKPNPSHLAMPEFDEDLIRRTLREGFSIGKGCRMEAIMKDCHTIGGDPRRATEWVRIAKEEAERVD